MNKRKGKGKSHKLQGLGFPKLEPSSGGHKAPIESKIHKIREKLIFVEDCTFLPD